MLATIHRILLIPICIRECDNNLNCGRKWEWINSFFFFSNLKGLIFPSPNQGKIQNFRVAMAQIQIINILDTAKPATPATTELPWQDTGFVKQCFQIRFLLVTEFTTQWL